MPKSWSIDRQRVVSNTQLDETIETVSIGILATDGIRLDVLEQNSRIRHCGPALIRQTTFEGAGCVLRVRDGKKSRQDHETAERGEGAQ